MLINELPSPEFLINDAGMISVFLPAFEGEPENPVLSRENDTTLYFQRSSEGGILLTEIDEEVMDALAGTKKILVIETNVLKSIDVLEDALSSYIKSEETNPDEAQDEIMDTIERAYEVEVDV